MFDQKPTNGLEMSRGAFLAPSAHFLVSAPRREIHCQTPRRAIDKNMCFTSFD